MKLCFLSNGPFAGFKSSLYALFSSLLEKNIDITLCLILKEDKNIDLSDLDKRVNVIKKIVTSDGENKIRKKKIFYPSILKLYINIYSDLIFKKSNNLKHAIYYNQVFNKFFVKGIKQSIDLSEYDAVISWEETFNNYLLAEKISAKKKIAFIHPDYKETHFSKFIDGPFLRKVDRICLVSHSNYQSFCSQFPTLKKKARAVVNLVDCNSIDKKLLNTKPIVFNKSVFNIVTVCRFDNNSKALDRALLLSKKLKSEGVNFNWHFIGDGDYYNEMSTNIKEYGLQDKVFLYGFKENPYPYIKNANLFVLQSYYEGYPMCVLESLYLKTPVLISNFKSAHEIIKDGVSGFVADNNFDAIYSKLKNIIINNEQIKIRKNLESYNINFDDCSEFLNVLNF